jgi:hypothetical protein
MAHYIVILKEVVSAAEQVKGYWDESGLDMHIAVKKSGQIVVSTKHWGRVHYLIPKDKISPDDLWNILGEVSDDVGRKLIKSEKGPYVYIHKLNINQTQHIFDTIKRKIVNFTIERHLEWSWDISDVILP